VPPWKARFLRELAPSVLRRQQLVGSAADSPALPRGTPRKPRAIAFGTNAAIAARAP
jgi:hypothetical protein